MIALASTLGSGVLRAEEGQPAATVPGTVQEQTGQAVPPTGLAGSGASVAAGTVVIPGAVATSPAGAPRVVVATSSPVMHDFTVQGMFMGADNVVKAVMAILALASVATWTVLLLKVFGLLFAKRRIRVALKAIQSASTLAEATLAVRKGLAARLLGKAEAEMRASRGLPSEGIKERVLIALERVETGAARRLSSGTGILASIGSTGPFVGLLGTVWGIMNSFIGISKSNTTNLAVVAPGIAEALLATAIGLVAAIPAVLIYNALSRSIGGYKIMIGDVSALVMQNLSRDLDCRDAGRTVALRQAAE